MKRVDKPLGAMPVAPLQLLIAFEQPQLWLMHVTGRWKIVVSLANRSMQAPGDAAEQENSDEGR